MESGSWGEEKPDVYVFDQSKQQSFHIIKVTMFDGCVGHFFDLRFFSLSNAYVLPSIVCLALGVDHGRDPWNDCQVLLNVVAVISSTRLWSCPSALRM